jgi:hypothetical protein
LFRQTFATPSGFAIPDIARIIDTSPPHNLDTFARALAKIAYCNAVLRYGLDGFRPLVLPDIILGRYPHVAHFVRSDPTGTYTAVGTRQAARGCAR